MYSPIHYWLSYVYAISPHILYNFYVFAYMEDGPKNALFYTEMGHFFLPPCMHTSDLCIFLLPGQTLAID